MDPALKQRLLGAAVLIALAIIFVPMFLGNSPQKQESTTVNMETPPADDHKFETRTLPVAGPSAPVANPSAAPSDPNKVVTVDAVATPKVDAHPEDQTPPPATVASTPPAPATVKPAAPAEPESAAPASGRFAVNLGIYADQGHVNSLIAKVKKLGFGAYSEPTEYQGKSAAARSRRTVRQSRRG